MMAVDLGRLTILALTAGLLAAADPYAAWQAGRPGEALPGLHATAQRADTWGAWLDCGLAAAEAGRRGAAIAWMLEAHRRAPARVEPRQAIAALGAPLPGGWIGRLGPIARPATGILAVGLTGIAGAALGWAIAGRRARGPALAVALVAGSAIAPGAIAGWLDGRRPWRAVVVDSALLDALGRPIVPLAEGTLVEVATPSWPGVGRIAIRLADGRLGWIPEPDLAAKP
jgi:hypothetical protein